MDIDQPTRARLTISKKLSRRRLLQLGAAAVLSGGAGGMIVRASSVPRVAAPRVGHGANRVPTADRRNGDGASRGAQPGHGTGSGVAENPDDDYVAALLRRPPVRGNTGAARTRVRNRRS